MIVEPGDGAAARAAEAWFSTNTIPYRHKDRVVDDFLAGARWRQEVDVKLCDALGEREVSTTDRLIGNDECGDAIRALDANGGEEGKDAAG